MPSENRSQVDLGRCTNLTGMGETWLHFNLHCVDNFLFIYLFPPQPPWNESLGDRDCGCVCCHSGITPVENQRPRYKSVLPMLGHYCTSVQVTAAAIQGQFGPRLPLGRLWQTGIQAGMWIFWSLTIWFDSDSWEPRFVSKIDPGFKNWHGAERSLYNIWFLNLKVISILMT